MSNLFSWAYFLADSSLDSIDPEVRVNRYEVTRIVPVIGEAALPSLKSLTRIESARRPLPVDALPPHLLSGVTQHLQYTDAEQRRELLRGAAVELPPSPDTVTVVIPIRKSDAWWSLATDQRIAHFQRSQNREGHTAIGLRHVSRIFRRLYHSRYLESAPAFDFVTYFEFKEEHTPDFLDLLRSLRDVDQNPEWGFVDAEVELWMRKVA